MGITFPNRSYFPIALWRAAFSFTMIGWRATVTQIGLCLSFYFAFYLSWLLITNFFSGNFDFEIRVSSCSCRISFCWNLVFFTYFIFLGFLVPYGCVYIFWVGPSWHLESGHWKLNITYDGVKSLLLYLKVDLIWAGFAQRCQLYLCWLLRLCR